MLKVITTALILQTSSLLACSIGINEQSITNTLVSKVANEFNIDLAKVKKIEKQNFSHQLIGEDPQTHCPLIIEAQADIILTYRENLTTQCQLSVTAKEIADDSIGYLTYEFLLPASSCSYTPIRINRDLIKPIRRKIHE